MGLTVRSGDDYPDAFQGFFSFEQTALGQRVRAVVTAALGRAWALPELSTGGTHHAYSRGV
jgi:hypothetical protein